MAQSPEEQQIRKAAKERKQKEKEAAKAAKKEAKEKAAKAKQEARVAKLQAKEAARLAKEEAKAVAASAKQAKKEAKADAKQAKIDAILAKEDEKQAKIEAKKKKNEEKGIIYEEDDESLGSKFLVFLVTMMIIAVWLAIFALLVKMDVGGFGSTVLSPVLKDVPVLNRILPKDENYEEEPEPEPEPDYAEVDEAYRFDSMEDAVNRIKALEAQIADMQAAEGSNAARMAELEAQSQELQRYKENEAAFEAEKEKFYNEVVFSENAPDIKAYKEYYESIDPDTAAAIYRQIMQKEKTDQEIEDYVKAYSSMKPKAAAAIFNTMTDNLKLVARILENMDAESRGNILGAMDQETAALVTAIMEP